MVTIQNVKEKVLTTNGVQVYCTPMALVSVLSSVNDVSEVPKQCRVNLANYAVRVYVSRADGSGSRKLDASEYSIDLKTGAISYDALALPAGANTVLVEADDMCGICHAVQFVLHVVQNIPYFVSEVATFPLARRPASDGTRDNVKQYAFTYEKTGQTVWLPTEQLNDATFGMDCYYAATAATTLAKATAVAGCVEYDRKTTPADGFMDKTAVADVMYVSHSYQLQQSTPAE